MNGKTYMHSVLDKMNKKLLAAEHNNHHTSHAASEFTSRANLVAIYPGDEDARLCSTFG